MPLGRRRKRSRKLPSSSSASEHQHVRHVPPPSQQVMVKRDLLVTCVTCLLCQGLLRDATTIPECLHSFCRKCIMKKLVDEEEECCPICKTDLGGAPVEKLRADHHLQYLREKIFPLKRKRITSSEPPQNPNSDLNPNSNPNPNPLPEIQTQNQKVKERSLSSLVAQNGCSLNKPKTSRRPVSLSKEALSPSSNGNAKKKAKNIEPKQEEETPPPVIMTYTRRHINSDDAEGSNNHTPKKDSESKGGLFCNKEEIEGPNGKLEAEACNAENKGENERKIIKRNVGTKRRNKISAQTLISTRPVWFSLIASSHSEGGAVLPQLTSNYLRIKDGNIPLSSVQKYIKNKLGLSPEAEVEIMCRGQAIDTSITLYDIINIWIRNESSHKTKTLVGSSAKDFVMVLMYHLKSNLQ